MTSLPALPTQKTPGWEFTDLAELDLDAYAPSANGSDGSDAVRLLDPVPGALSLTQVDSRPAKAPEAAAGDATPDAAVVMPLSAARERYPDLVGDHLGSLARAEDPFVARNDADWDGGAFIYIPPGITAEQPIELAAIQTAAGSVMNWRVLIVLAEGAEAEVTEQYLSSDPELDAVLNGVVEIVVGPAARLRYTCAQGLSERSWIFATQRAEVGRDARLEWVALGFGSARGKVRMETRLGGQGAEAKVTGAYAGGGEQHLDYDTKQEHAAPQTNSDLAFRGVLADRATAVWRGMIRVDPAGQKTDAFQESRNLLLSKQAHADSIPGLEIEADDVRCTHAAAVAQVDPDQLHYLRARGLPEAGAKRLIIEGFLEEIVQRLPAGAVHDSVSAALERRLAEILDPA